MFQKSFRARLILGAVIWISVGIGVSGFVLAAILRDVMTTQFDHDLSDHAEELAGLIDIDSQEVPFVRRNLSDPRFAPLRSGLYWQVQRRNGVTARSPSLDSFDLPMAPSVDAAQFPIRAIGPTGPIRLLQKQIQPPQLSEPVQISVGVDERLIDEAMLQFNRTLALSLGILALGLIGAACAQVTFGLRPLARVRRSLAAFRSGAVERLPDDLPEEVLPLVTDLNALIASNQDMVRRARVEAGNLAHALKTPLTILMEEGRELEKAGQFDAAHVLIQQCKRLQRQIDYQTARARAGARAAPGTATMVGPVIRNITAALSRLESNRTIAFEISGPEQLVAACNSQDLSEMMSNLLDNAAKWGRSRVIISIQPIESIARITVEDDGPGIPAQHFETVFGIGERLDECMPGSGLGLAITRDLATLYGGRAWIERSQLGGVSACLELARISPLS